MRSVLSRYDTPMKLRGLVLLAFAFLLAGPLSKACEGEPQKQTEYALELYKKGKWEELEKECRELLTEDPNLVEAHRLLGLALERQGDQDGGLAEYRAVIRLQPQNDKAYIAAANILSQKGEVDAAIAEYRAAIELKPGDAQYHFQLGLLLDRNSDLRGALEEYRVAGQLDPNKREISAMYEGLVKELQYPGLVPIKIGKTNPGSNISEPVPTYRPNPGYSEGARRDKLQGTLLLAVIIAADGSIASVRVLKGLEPGLERNAVKAVQSWRFKPAARNGVPVPVRVLIEVKFTLF